MCITEKAQEIFYNTCLYLLAYSRVIRSSHTPGFVY